MVDEQDSASASIAGTRLNSINYSVLDKEGILSPPLDEVTLSDTQPTTLELSQFFNKMDGNGNITSIDDLIKIDFILKTPLPEDCHPSDAIRRYYIEWK